MDFLLKIIEINGYILYNANILNLHPAYYFSEFCKGVLMKCGEFFY
jgi:hypothetical protein